MTGSVDWLIVGKLVGAQGLQGELRVNPRSDFPERFLVPGKRWLSAKNTSPREVKLIKGRSLPGKSLYVVRFAGINNRNEAEALIGQNLLVPAANRPELEEDEFHLLDLIDLQVRLDQRGPHIGHVTDLTSAGNDLLEIQLIEGRKVLVPFVKQIVPEVNLIEGWILLTPPSGLLEL